MKHFIYHENNQKYPYLPQEDSYFHDLSNGVFVVADGVTHDVMSDGFYPDPSDAAEVARIVCRETVLFLKDKEFSTDSITQAFIHANTKVKFFNENRDLYKHRESNGYTIGAAVAALVWIRDTTLLYGVLDDCFFSVFSEDLVDHPILKSFVDHSAKLIDNGMDWNDPKTRKFWRKDLRNHHIDKDGITYGYGALDGSLGFDLFLQTGKVQLMPRDLICVYSDGFIKTLKNKELITDLWNTNISTNSLETVARYVRDVGDPKEKTCYFIKV